MDTSTGPQTLPEAPLTMAGAYGAQLQGVTPPLAAQSVVLAHGGRAVAPVARQRAPLAPAVRGVRPAADERDGADGGV
jgi:hypothetical protein